MFHAKCLLGRTHRPILLMGASRLPQSGTKSCDAGLTKLGTLTHRSPQACHPGDCESAHQVLRMLHAWSRCSLSHYFVSYSRLISTRGQLHLILEPESSTLSPSRSHPTTDVTDGASCPQTLHSMRNRFSPFLSWPSTSPSFISE